MDIGDIIKDAIYYPINDKDRFIKLAIPNLILGVLLGIMTILGMNMTNTSYDAAYSLYMTTGLFAILMFIVMIVVLVIDSGITVDVIRNTINNNNILPDLNIADDLLMGLKSFIVIFLYVFIPLVIYIFIIAIFAALVGSSENSPIALLMILLTIIVYVLMFIVMLLMPVILGTLAKTNSISQSLQVNDVWNSAKEIGLLNLFILAILIGVIGFVISLVGTFLSIIPVIGVIITMGLIYTYLMLFNARCYGLIFNNQNQNQYQLNNQYGNPQYPTNQYNPANNQYPNQDYNNQQYYQQPMDYQQDNQTQNIPQENNPLDYNSQNMNTQMATKTCIACGFANPQDAKHCGNCGNQL